ncbi:MAG TPA: AraC family transcriptional regulator [Patescibacteria group bacterium]|nr:MAG: hypothetical protein A2417_16445 [Bdellovibrionales bacterium RIFOXYC1_FULL_37_79]OFZ59170.1 MAG: hypothetical protein A2381_03850 [Bdellovibrionales bacterium RIFOXYB1_FULL_37_110]OFZ64175.1 MAG: hypothetical protein A2577_14880 [Bdellovibrionales bacterium RIFOXYD1_FULL_36_51]HLD89904.1 AraC family transcriptional regulator [Patescibacteria group bacterium]
MSGNDYLNQVQRAIDFIEDNLNKEILIRKIANEGGMSQWHFQRMFRAITGDTVKEYVRNRRLTFAARMLRSNKNIRILDLALDCQFESQESFSRAFKKYFGITPKKFISSSKDLNMISKLRIDEVYLEHLQKGVTMKPKIIEKDEMKLVGIGVQFIGVFSEGGKDDKVIPQLWGRFKTRISEIKNRVEAHRIGIVDCYPTDSEYESDDNLVYFACVEVNSFCEIPKGMRAMIIPKSKFASFTHNGEPNDIDRTLKYIYGSWLPKSDYKRANGPDFEVLSKDYPKNGEYDYWLPIE